MTGVYKKESVDVISVSLYLQGLQKDELAPEFTELDPEDNLSDSDYKLDNVYPATDHIGIYFLYNFVRFVIFFFQIFFFKSSRVEELDIF